MAGLFTTQEFCTLAVSLYSIHVCSLTMWSTPYVIGRSAITCMSRYGMLGVIFQVHIKLPQTKLLKTNPNRFYTIYGLVKGLELGFGLGYFSVV